MSVNDGLPSARHGDEAHPRRSGARHAVLGVCSGAQLIGRIRATVRRAAEEEIGWFEVAHSGATRTPLLPTVVALACLSVASGDLRPARRSHFARVVGPVRSPGVRGFATRLTVSSSIQR